MFDESFLFYFTAHKKGENSSTAVLTESIIRNFSEVPVIF